MKVYKVAFYGKSIYNWVEKVIFAFKGALGTHPVLVLHIEVTVSQMNVSRLKGLSCGLVEFW